MTEWGDALASLIGDVTGHASRAAGQLRSFLTDEPSEILAYRGYGNSSRAYVYGRALEKRGVSISTDTDSNFRNLVNTYRRADSDPVPFADVRVSITGTAMMMKADDEGFFGGWVERSIAAEPDPEWLKYDVSLLSPLPPGFGAIEGSGEVLIPPLTVRFGVISDLDDTVIQSRVSNFLQAARTVMLGNARTRLPFPGVAAFYRALRNGGAGNEANPIFYVSSSPWNIYDVIVEFMALQGIPSGPVLLRDWDIGLSALSASRHLDHKGAAIRNILQLYPNLPFILVGDSSQHDPEIYRAIVAEFPDRIRAIYIRDVTRTPDRAASIKKLADEVVAAGSVLVIAEDTLGAARHAVERGWIDAASLPDIGEEKRADEGRNEAKAPAPDGGKPGTGEQAEVIGEGR